MRDLALRCTLAIVVGASLAWCLEPALAAAQEAAKPTRAQRAQARAQRKRAQKEARAERASAADQGPHSARKRRSRAVTSADPTAGTTRIEARSSGDGAASNTQAPARRPEVSARTEGNANAAEAARAAASGANSEIVKEGDTSVKVMKFEGLGIEGRLKSPQLAYFVERTRAEFERPALPHRSFLPELQRTTQREPVR